MKLPIPSFGPRRPLARPQAAFTLPEILVASTLFLLLVGGVVTANIFGLKMSQLTQSKLDTSSALRKTIGRMTDEIRTCKSTYVGSVSNGQFTALTDGDPQTGNGLLIYPTTNTTNYIIYFVNPSDQTFKRLTSASSTNASLVSGVTNLLAFSAQDYLGNVLTNEENIRVIHFTVECFQQQAHLPVPDYYKIETCVTKRALE